MSLRLQRLLLELHQRAEAAGRGQRVLDAYQRITRRLKRDPRVFGEELYTLPAMKLEIRTAAIHPLIVDYGVHLEQKLVFIQGFKMLD